MTIKQRLTYLAARMKSLYPAYRVEICRVRGFAVEELPIINIIVPEDSEDDDALDTVSFQIEVDLKREINADAPDDADRDMFFDLIDHAADVKRVLRSPSLLRGTGVEGIDAGPFGVVGDISTSYRPDVQGAYVVGRAFLTFTVDHVVSYVYEEEPGEMLEARGQFVGNGQAVEAELMADLPPEE